MRLRSGDLPVARHAFNPRWALGFGLGAAVLAIALFWSWSPAGSRKAPIEARWQGAAAQLGTALVASQTAATPIEFSDGSQIVLQPSAVAKLETVDAQRTGLVLERGRVAADIQHNGRAWTIAAGPYQVRVTGTQFTVDWDRASGFRVAVSRGSVHVTGGDLPPSGVDLRAGQELSRAQRGAQATVAAKATATPSAQAHENVVEVADLPMVSDDEQESVVRRPNTRRGRSAHDDGPATDEPTLEPESWQSLAETGAYAEAVRRAEEVGFDGLLATSSQSDLLLLANSARYARNSQRAKQAYTTLRRRFGGTHAARLSAYYLARLAGDVEHQPRSEAAWLRTYLSESPSGELSASARARLMELLRGLGESEAAKAVASDYLRHHPNGPHADVARSLLGQ
jgi:hypothetical protein